MFISDRERIPAFLYRETKVRQPTPVGKGESLGSETHDPGFVWACLD